MKEPKQFKHFKNTYLTDSIDMFRESDKNRLDNARDRVLQHLEEYKELKQRFIQAEAEREEMIEYFKYLDNLTKQELKQN